MNLQTVRCLRPYYHTRTLATVEYCTVGYSTVLYCTSSPDVDGSRPAADSYKPCTYPCGYHAGLAGTVRVLYCTVLVSLYVSDLLNVTNSTVPRGTHTRTDTVPYPPRSYSTSTVPKLRYFTVLVFVRYCTCGEILKNVHPHEQYSYGMIAILRSPYRRTSILVPLGVSGPYLPGGRYGTVFTAGVRLRYGTVSGRTNGSVICPYSRDYWIWPYYEDYKTE